MKRSRLVVKFDERREMGRLVEGEDFEFKKTDFEVNAMMNW